MRSYAVHILRWAVTLSLAYGAYKNSQPYTAVAIIWIMAWIEVYIFIVGNILITVEAQSLCINTLFTKKITEDAKAINEIIDRLQGAPNNEEKKDDG